jgi:hypothetical protein
LPARHCRAARARNRRHPTIDRRFWGAIQSRRGPKNRLHQHAAQAVLNALLPKQGTDIKGNMRSYAELLHASGYARRPRDSEELLRRDGAIVELAQSIYATQRFEDVPGLADALEEAGCKDSHLLHHCRHSTPHTRGCCWVIDSLLGNTALEFAGAGVQNSQAQRRSSI